MMLNYKDLIKKYEKNDSHTKFEIEAYLLIP